jgi:hypothetical protein
MNYCVIHDRKLCGKLETLISENQDTEVNGKITLTNKNRKTRFIFQNVWAMDYYMQPIIHMSMLHNELFTMQQLCSEISMPCSIISLLQCEHK